MDKVSNYTSLSVARANAKRQRSRPSRRVFDLRFSQNKPWFKSALAEAEKRFGVKAKFDSEGGFTDERIQKFMMNAMRKLVSDAVISDRKNKVSIPKPQQADKDSLSSKVRKSTRRIGASVVNRVRDAAASGLRTVTDTAGAISDTLTVPFSKMADGYHNLLRRNEIRKEIAHLDAMLPPERVIHSGNPVRPKPKPAPKPRTAFDDYADEFFARHGITSDDDLRKIFPDPASQRRAPKLETVDSELLNSSYSLGLEEKPAEPVGRSPNPDFENSMFGETQYELEPKDEFADYLDFIKDYDQDASSSDDQFNNSLYD